MGGRHRKLLDITVSKEHAVALEGGRPTSFWDLIDRESGQALSMGFPGVKFH